MTREEAIKSALKFLVSKQQEQGSWGYADNDDTNEVSWDEIIEWIDQQTCGDCVSRQAVLEVQTKYAEHMGATKYWQMRDDINGLPSVESERKTGKWIRGEAYPHHIYCSECYKTFIPNDEMRAWVDGDLPRKYCPECGARMEVDG